MTMFKRNSLAVMLLTLVAYPLTVSAGEASVPDATGMTSTPSATDPTKRMALLQAQAQDMDMMETILRIMTSH